MACQLFENGHFQEARRTLLSATAVVKEANLVESPRMCPNTFALLLDICSRGRFETALKILEFFSNLSQVMLNEKHPIRRIYTRLAFMEASQLQDVAIRRLESSTNPFESLCRPMHYSTVTSRRRYIEMVYGRRNDDREGPALQNFLQKCELTLGEGDFRKLDVRLSFASYLLAKDRY